MVRFDQKKNPGVNQEVLENVTKNTAELKQELVIQSQQEKVTKTPLAVSHIKYLQDQGDKYVHKIELEKQRLAELDRQIEIVDDKLLAQQQKMGGINASRENNAGVAKQIRTLEGRLDKALLKYNTTLGKNTKFRDQINEYRKERAIYDGIFRKLEVELQDQSKRMQDEIHTCNKCYMERKDLQTQLESLKAEVLKEEKEFEAQCAEIREQIEKESQDQIEKATNEEEKGDEHPRIGNMSVEEEQQLKKKIVKGAWFLGKEKAHVNISHEKIASYEDAFNRIQEATGIEDLHVLVTKFLEAEDKNFSMFQYMNDMNSELEKVEQSILEVRGEIDKYRGQGSSVNNQRKRILRDLEVQLEKTESRATVFESRHQEAQRTLQQLKHGISALFTKIGCDTNSVEEVLGHDGVTEGNIMQYLGIIEQRANEILQLFAASQQKGTSALNNLLGFAPTSGAMSSDSAQVKEGSFELKGNADDASIAGNGDRTLALFRVGGNSGNMASPANKQLQHVMSRMMNVDLPSLEENEEGDDFDDRPLFLKELQAEALKRQQLNRFRNESEQKEQLSDPSASGSGQQGMNGHYSQRRLR